MLIGHAAFRFARVAMLVDVRSGRLLEPHYPDAYVETLARQYPFNSRSDDQPRPAIAIADYGLHSAVKTAVACERAGIDHVVGLRVPVVPQRAYRTWNEKPGELIPAGHRRVGLVV